ncbi:MAG: hypothetical protein SF028_12840 [Candidatus Sumerlaeia bacterium]|nr:hypothetical protein [Candidatus Sumerlaeia bacterium]
MVNLAAQSPSQVQAVEAVLTQVQRYLDARQPAVCRMNPNLERVWDDLVFQGIAQLHLTLANTKAFGPVRYHIAETFLGDDERRKSDFMSPTHQNSILYEIVEKDDAAGAKRMEGNLEIHDLRTLFKMIEPAFINTVSLIQTFIWWDFLDAVDMARVDLKAGRIRAYREGKLNDQIRAWYKDMMKTPDAVSDEDITVYELWQTRASIQAFEARRQGEPGYKRIVSRDYSGGDNPELLIRAIANQLAIIDHLKAGKPLDPALSAQLAGALKIDQSLLTPDRALSFLEKSVPEQKARLRAVLGGNAPGRPFNLKERQAADLEKRFKDLAGETDVPEKLPHQLAQEALKDKGTAAR